MEIYIVVGVMTSYDDYMHWNVSAYTNRLVATTHMERANKFLASLTDDQRSDIELSPPNPYDPDMSLGYGDLEYLIHTVELSDINTIEEFEESIFIDNL